MTSFFDFHTVAAARGEGLHPKLRALFERVSVAPCSELPIKDNGMVQSGPDPISAEVAKEPANVLLFPQPPHRRKGETNEKREMPARPLRKHGA